jgi:hypothetical protein
VYAPGGQSPVVVFADTPVDVAARGGASEASSARPRAAADPASNLDPDLSLPRLIRSWNEAAEGSAAAIPVEAARRRVERARAAVTAACRGRGTEDPDGIAHAATIANANGAPISTIYKLGRWKENSPVVHAVIGWRSSPS